MLGIKWMMRKKNKKRKSQKIESNLSKKKVGSKATTQKHSTISACLIVKNEEEMLPKCLESIKGFVDEIIVVDTGSKDGTVEIAKRHGAKVYHHPWENDFSKHRNQSRSYAKSDWIFQIDADEVLAPGCGKIVRDAVEDDSVDSIYVTIKSAFDHSRGEAVHNFIRIFRNNGKIHYEGRVHNRIVGAKASRFHPIILFHEGYNLDPEKEEKKYLRTHTLLKQEIENDPENPMLHHYLAVAYLGRQNYAKALEESQKALGFASRRERGEDLYLWTRFVGAVSCMNTNRLDEAERICLKAIQNNPMHLDSHYLLSSLYYAQGNIQSFLHHSNTYLTLIKQVKDNSDKFGLMVHNTIKHEWRIHLHRGFAFTTNDNQEEAYKEFSLSLKKCDGKGEYFKQRCLIHLQRSEYKSAAIFLRKALKYNPEDKELDDARLRLSDTRNDRSMISAGKNKANAPTISLCMIVKNEEKFLPQCLDSVKDCVDEIVIVDTGSTDKTVEIAKKYTDRIYFHPWEGDFSKHRNQSIKYATKDWIFILDADEVLLAQCGKTVRESIQDESIDSVYVVVKSAFDGGAGEAVHNSIRIFRNNGNIHYEGRVHNRIVGTKESKIFPITIFHEGYNLPHEESQKKFIRTTTLLKKEIKDNPLHPRAYHYLAASYLSEEMYEKALKTAMKAIQLANENNYTDHIYLWSHFIAALLYMKTDRLDEADQICLKAIKKSHNHLDSHYLLTIIYYNKKDFEKLFYHSNEYFTLLNKTQKTPGEFGPMVHNTINHQWRVHLHRAFAFQEMDREKEAEDEYVRAFNNCDVKGEYYKLLASFHNSRKEFSKAEGCLIEALNHDPDDKELYRLGARIYCELGVRDKEKDFLAKAIKRGADDLKELFRLGTIYLEEKRYSESSNLLEKVVEMDESHLGARINLGVIAKRSGDLNSAIRHLKRALKVSPNSVEALSNLGYVYFDKKNFSKAKELFEHLGCIDPTLLDVSLMLSMIYIRLGRIEPVVAECDKILSLLEMDRNIILNSVLDLSNLFIKIGKVLLERGQPAVGTLAFDVASHLSDESDVILKKIGAVCFQEGYYDGSLKYLEKAVSLNPQDWESFFIMGSCYEKMGVQEGAALSYEKARELNPDNTALEHFSTQ